MPPGPSGACAAPLRTGYSSPTFHLMRMGRGLQAHWSQLFWWSCDQSLLGCKAHVISLQSFFTSPLPLAMAVERGGVPLVGGAFLTAMVCVL